ncbi:MAG: bifunctional [glutamate--ammonia ligase]-adenylyl-L-tyrosine phosphorylase/[glutamate--ammonia-ligase] adenylyltransferase, partial [Woeseia sp.]
MKSKLIASLPDELNGVVSHWFDHLASCHPDAIGAIRSNEAFSSDLTRLVACSEFAADTIVREWPWVLSCGKNKGFRRPPDARALDSFVAEVAERTDDVDTVKRRLRQFRNRWLLHVLWRDICAEAGLADTLGALTDLADNLIAACTTYATTETQKRFGKPRNDAGGEIPVVVLAMGKLGGRELNFSSDVDLIFLYPDGGETDGRRRISAHEYFTRLTRQIIALLDEVTPDGFVFRVDTRLRPFGDSGPPVVSFAALESYLPQHGRSWERYAYIKARITGAAVSDEVAEELMVNLIEPFVYRRYIDFGVLEAMREMKALVAAEVRNRELASNIKLGPGGIREVEFIVQSLQLVRGGSDRTLRCRELQVALPRLAHNRGLTPTAVDELQGAYTFLRRLENSIQALRDRQSHDLPTDPTDRARLCLAMNYADWDCLLADLDGHRGNVNRHFDSVLFGSDRPESRSTVAITIAERWAAPATAAQWRDVLQQQGFGQAGELSEILTQFQCAPLTKQIDEPARQRLDQFMPKLLLRLREQPEPLQTLRRVLDIVERILRRSAYVALLNENPLALERLVSLSRSSAYIAGQISRHPQLMDELLDPRAGAPSAEEMAGELEQRITRLGTTDSEQRVEALGQFQRATLFRIAVADFGGELPIMKVSDRLTDLAELILNKALDTAYADLVAKHGEPGSAGFGVIAYGKFGGIELSYRSDLDLVFLHESPRPGESGQMTDGGKPLEISVFFGRLVGRLVHFLTTQTGSGALYQVDTRLRPSGRSGLLVTSVEAFERYQEENAWTWEHQALLRSRPVAGSARVAREFERVRAETLRNRVRRNSLLADVLSMRDKMRDRLDRSDSDSFDLKQGAGGIGDIEFIVQYLVLRHAKAHPAVIHYPDNIRQLGTLAAAACLAEADAVQLQDIYKKYRSRLHHLALDEKPPLVPDGEFAAERKFVTGIW